MRHRIEPSSEARGSSPEGEPRRIPAQVFAAVMLPMFLAVVDATMVATALPSIAGSLGDVERISWVVVAYLVAMTITAPVYGRLGDLAGRRRLMFLALSVYMAASIFCALSTSLFMLLSARIVQGAGGGGLMTLSQALIGEAVPLRERGRYQGYLAAVVVTSTTFGPVAGGFLTQYFGWQSVFLVGPPVGLIAMLLLLKLPDRRGTGSLIHFDILGVILFGSFIASTLITMQHLRDFDTVDLTTLGWLGTLSISSLFLLVWRERRAHDPLLPIPLFRNPIIWRCNGLAACHGALWIALVTFLPIYFRVVHGVEAGRIGLLMLPMMIGVGIGSMTTGRAVTRTGLTAIFPSIGMPVFTAALVFIAFWSTEASAVSFSLALGVSAVFLGTVMSVAQIMVQAAAGPNRLGTAAASVQFSRSLGAAFGATMVGAILFAVLAAGNPETAVLFRELLQRGSETLTAVPAAQRAAIAGDIDAAFRAAFIAAASFAALASLLAWTLPMRRL